MIISNQTHVFAAPPPLAASQGKSWEPKASKVLQHYSKSAKPNNWIIKNINVRESAMRNWNRKKLQLPKETSTDIHLGQILQKKTG